MGWSQEDIYEAAIEQWIQNFIDTNDREPTDEEIEAASYDAYVDYMSGEVDAYIDRMREGD